MDALIDILGMIGAFLLFLGALGYFLDVLDRRRSRQAK